MVEDVTRIRRHPLVNPAIPVYGYVYDVKTGRLNEVAAATKSGRPTAGPRRAMVISHDRFILDRLEPEAVGPKRVGDKRSAR